MNGHRSLQDHLENAESLQPVNEILLTLVAGAILCHCLTPALNTEGGKAIAGGVGLLLSGIGSLFGCISSKRDDKKDDKKKGKPDDDKDDDTSRPSKKPTTTPSKDTDKTGDDPTTDPGDDKVKDINSAPSKNIFKSMLGWCGLGGDKEKEYGKDIAGVLLDKDGNVKDMPFSEEDANKLKEINKKHGKNEDADPQKLLNDAKEAIRKDPSIRIKAIKEGHKMTIAKLNNDLKIEQADLREEYAKKMEGKSKDEKKELKKELEEKIEASKKLLKDRIKTQEAARDKLIEIAKANGNNTTTPKDDDDDEEKEVGTVMHNGEETKIIRRPNKREKGKFVYCYANDRDVTVSPDDMRHVKESLQGWIYTC